MISIDEMCKELRRCYDCTLKTSCFGCPYNGSKLDIIQYLKNNMSEENNMSEIERKQRLLKKLRNREHITDSDLGIGTRQELKNRIDNVPLDTPVYLIDHNHNLYTGTIIKTATGELQRGECFSGDVESFYRSAIVDWAYL